ncbi:MAG TPA: FtsQ-type POTRA domain-containing protein [Candidatus Pacearchaeota archaeon]|nr:FtsQ-type POTRA domain-containing protein [Candidatus Pacearchaeota archaeon]HQI74715.1 FtsQ-type POTRA domain-containing protein [Candidatus Pacearchaeota archaeon]
MIRKAHTIRKISQRRAQKARKKFLILLSAFFILFIAVFWLLTYSKYFQISKISVSGNKKIPSQNIQESANNFLRQKAFIPKTNIFFLNKKNLSQDLEKNFLIIKNTSLKKKLPNEIQIIIEERPEYAVWCQNMQSAYQEAQLQQGEQSYSTSSGAVIVSDQCFFTDEFGMIFQETNNHNFIIKSRQIGKKEGDFVISKDLLDLISDVRTKCQSMAKIKLVSADIISENQINFSTDQGWEIYINPKKTIDIQLMALKSVLDLKIPPEKRNKLEYIDLRFETVSIYPNLLKEEK